MRRFGITTLALVFLLQAFMVASMPAVSVSADGEVIVICTSTGMKTVPLAQFLGTQTDQGEEQPAPDDMASGGLCVFCLAAHQVALAPSLNFSCATDLHAHAPQAPPVDAPILSAPRRTQQARAPPSNA